MEALGEVDDRIDPISKPSYALRAVQHYTVTEYQFVFLGIRSASTQQIENFVYSPALLKSQKKSSWYPHGDPYLYASLSMKSSTNAASRRSSWSS